MSELPTDDGRQILNSAPETPAQSPFPSAATPITEPPKKSKKVLWIILSLVAAILVGIGVAFAIFTLAKNNTVAEQEQSVVETEETKAEDEPDLSAYQPTSTDLKDAASELIMINYELVKKKDYKTACQLHSQAHIEGIAYRAGLTEKDCPTILELAYKQGTDSIALAEREGFMPIVPYYYIPTSIKIDKTKMEVDNDSGSSSLIYIGPGTILSTDQTPFGKTADHDTPVDDSDRTPGWLTETMYIKKQENGVWQFVRSIEQ